MHAAVEQPEAEGAAAEAAEARNRELRGLLARRPGLLEDALRQECVAALGRTLAFSQLSDDELCLLSRLCERVTFLAGDEIVRPGDPVQAAFVISSGHVQRPGKDLSEVMVDLEAANPEFCPTIGILSLHRRMAVPRQHSRCAVCISDVVAFRIDAEQYQRLLISHPQLAVGVVESLSHHISEWDAVPRTALLSQQARPAPPAATAAAAALEAGYRYLLDAMRARKVQPYAAEHSASPPTAAPGVSRAAALASCEAFPRDIRAPRERACTRRNCIRLCFPRVRRHGAWRRASSPTL
eukprot:TRINITY_DN31831_c0_g1_i2.p1 TRINITY_DN31831_c0_g1~~TRINITY_DN31831_c0_g1_i2.p1  ORF type:complete len:319 (+),score=66.01 TRINITY_DN31831_c0_g1_i2:72-959(+)